MKKIKITKMQGCGNDFVIVDNTEYEKTNMQMSEFAKKVCNRNFGIGADGLIIPKTDSNNADISWYFFNSDGSKAQMCGNGMRCFARYVTDKGLVNKKKFTVETDAGIIEPQILESGCVRVNMGKPILVPEKIPCTLKNCLNQQVKIEEKIYEINAVSMGNPHCIVFCDKNENLLELTKNIGKKFENSSFFPEKVNTEFVKIISRKEIEMCVWERGCGITLACGTGACASVVVSILNNLTDNNVKVNLLGGAVSIEWQGSLSNYEQNVFLEGPSEYSFFAEYLL